jgi:hypothetical protein
MTFCGNPLSRSLSELSGHGLVHRICLLLTQADIGPLLSTRRSCYDLWSEPRASNETAFQNRWQSG